MRSNALLGFLIAVAYCVFAPQAHAQLLNTWVSSLGSDANPCSRALPCLTFGGAIAKTNAGGTIGVIDPGEYGPVDITKSITIDGAGTFASIMTPSVHLPAMRITAGPNDRVVIRNLSFNGLHVGVDGGVIFESGRMLTLENCMFSRGARIVARSNRSNTLLTDVVMIEGAVHVSRPLNPPGFAIATVKNLQVESFTGPGGILTEFSFSAGQPSSASVTDSLFTGFTFNASLLSNAGGDLNLDNNVVVHGYQPFGRQSSGSATRLSDNLIMNHSYCEGGPFTFSYGNNAVAGIVSGEITVSPIGFQ